MRKLLTILAILGLAVSISALSARADGVTYTVTSTYASDTSPSLVSAPGASFTLVFTVPSPCSSSSTPPCSNLSLGFPSFSNIDVTFSSPTLPPFTSLATLLFNPSSLGGLFAIQAGDFDWEFAPLTGIGPQVFNTTAGEFCSGPAGTFCSGPFPIIGGTGFPTNPTGAFFFDMSNATIGGDLTGGEVAGTSTVPTPEPSSLLLLGSGFLALGFARKRLTARFN